MSTPSTAVATHPHQYYSHHQSYQPGLGAYPLANGYRLANPHSSTVYPAGRPASSNDSRPLNQPPPDSLQPSDDPADAAAAMGPAGETPGRAKRKPDWSEFYKNGVPKEVIVIDDDDEPSGADASRAAAPNDTANGAAKRRKTGQAAANDPVYQQQTSYSTTQTPYAEHSSSHNTVSTDRTTSALNTTAPTSLGSQVSTGTYTRAPAEDGVAGQKRKRSTRQAAQDEAAREAKKRHLERPEDPYDHYLPPPNPPIKAKDVYVQVVHDVSNHLIQQTLKANADSSF